MELTQLESFAVIKKDDFMRNHGDDIKRLQDYVNDKTKSHIFHRSQIIDGSGYCDETQTYKGCFILYGDNLDNCDKYKVMEIIAAFSFECVTELMVSPSDLSKIKEYHSALKERKARYDEIDKIISDSEDIKRLKFCKK